MPVQVQMDLFDLTISPVNPAKLSSHKEISSMIFDIADALSSPIITYPGSWNETMPGNLIALIPTARIIALAKKERTATLPEAIAYMYPASLEFPLRLEWVHIYTWCGSQVFSKDPNLWTDIAPTELSKDEKLLLEQLRTWIYERRRKHLRTKQRTDPTAISEVDSQLVII